ncbi:MAG: phosphatidylglycerophosphatase A [Opitutae bacterium]|nr:phosphatidylglycerophosphatase A [Opitutae bacterium]
MRLTQPDWPRRLPPKFVTAVATLGPLGTRLPAPGTWGSLAGLLYVLVFFRHLNALETFALTVPAAWFAVGFTGEAARRLGKTDPGEIVLDEFVVMPLVFLGWHSGRSGVWPEWVGLLAGFALFRFYDILKPLGIRRLQSWPDGWGIVADDFAAALAAGGTLHLAAWLWTLR